MSKLPDMPSSIFTVMSQMAVDYNAINLSQGFPNFSIDPKLQKFLAKATETGANQYVHTKGLLGLREVLIDSINKKHNINFEADHNICITPGASYGIYTALLSIIDTMDEAILLEPAYDCYAPSVMMIGAIPVPVPLGDDFLPDWSLIEKSITSRTKVIVINSPHNPSGAVWSREDFMELERIALTYNLCVISDEVYEQIVFDGRTSYSILDFEGLRQKSVAIYSLGKTYHITGWKIGYVVGEEKMMKDIYRIHQFIAFCVNHPAQQALYDYILSSPKADEEVSPFFQSKRDYFLDQLKTTKFTIPFESHGTYFQLVDYSSVLGTIPDMEAATILCQQHGVASIPLSPFYQSAPSQYLLRFCFAKTPDMIDEAITRLSAL